MNLVLGNFHEQKDGGLALLYTLEKIWVLRVPGWQLWQVFAELQEQPQPFLD
jgi:hypothetical protein